MKTPLNIWDLSIQQSKEKRENLSSKPDSQASERSLLVVGSKEVGKTTLIHRFLESQDSAKPTLALEYTFGRKTNHNLAKVYVIIICLDLCLGVFSETSPTIVMKLCSCT